MITKLKNKLSKYINKNTNGKPQIVNRFNVNEADLLKLQKEKSFVKACKVKGNDIYIHVSADIELYRCETYETKEPETLTWIESFDKNDIFFDIGANIGVYSLYAAVANKCKVYSFEPESQNFAKLVSNIYLNKLDNVIPYCIALNHFQCIDLLYVTGFGPGDSQHNFGSENQFYIREYSGIKQGSISIPLDKLCYEYNLPIPNHIKIDVDGLEENIVKGSLQVLADSRVKSLLIEINSLNDIPSVIPNLLEQAGFKFHKHSQREYVSGNLRGRNYIFIK